MLTVRGQFVRTNEFILQAESLDEAADLLDQTVRYVKEAGTAADRESTGPDEVRGEYEEGEFILSATAEIDDGRDGIPDGSGAGGVQLEERKAGDEDE